MSFVRRAMVAVAALALLALLVAGAAHLPFIQTRVTDWVRARALADLGIALDADLLRYNLFNPSVELSNATLSVPGEPPFLRAGRVRAVLSRSLLYGIVELHDLEADEAHVAIVRHRDGHTNLPVTGGTASSSRAPIHVGLVTLRKLSFELSDESAGHRVTAGPFDLTIDSGGSVPNAGTFGPFPFAVR